MLKTDTKLLKFYLATLSCGSVTERTSISLNLAIQSINQPINKSINQNLYSAPS